MAPIAPNIALNEVQTLDQIVDRSVSPRRFFTLLLGGVVLGAAASWMVARLLRSQLFGVSSADPATFIAMVVIVMAVALVSGYLPARRASRTDPTAALRAG